MREGLGHDQKAGSRSEKNETKEFGDYVKRNEVTAEPFLSAVFEGSKIANFDLTLSSAIEWKD